MSPPRDRWTRAEFAKWAADPRNITRIRVTPPFDLVPCTCPDVNCHGWRFVERRDAAVRELVYEPVGAGA